MNKKPLLIFDYDGTLHDTLKIYEPAFRECASHLISLGYDVDADVPLERIKSWLGMNAGDMWMDYAPWLDANVRSAAAKRIGDSMLKMVRNGIAEWYEGAEDALDALKEEGYQLMILSNSSIRDGETHMREFNMKRWFDKWADCESYGWSPKTEIIKQICWDESISGQDIIVIGDRKSDMDAAKEIGAFSIGCAYGFGTFVELKEADVKVDSVGEIVDKIRLFR